MPLTNELKAHFLNLYHMALSDTKIDTKELEALYRIGETRGISRPEIDMLLLQPEQSGFSPPATVIEKIDCLYDLCLIAWADGVLDASEKDMVRLFCTKFGFLEENISQICDYLLAAAADNTPKQEILSIVSKNI